jgi:hypothetical protein
VLSAIVPLLLQPFAGLVPVRGQRAVRGASVGYVQDHLADALRITVGGIALAAGSACSASRLHR